MAIVASVKLRSWGVEWGVAAALTLVSLAFVALNARGMWFYQDTWEYVANRQIGSATDVLGANGANWETTTVILIRSIYGVVGLDFWPWYYLPRLIGYAALCLYLWRIVLRRGAHPAVAMATLGLLLVFGPSGYLAAGFMGHAVAIAMLMASATLVADAERPTSWDLYRLFVFTGAGLVSSGEGIIALIAVTVTLAATMRIKQWLAPLGAVWAMYVVWWLLYAEATTSSRLETAFRNVLDIPEPLLDLLHHSFAEILQVDHLLGWVLLPAAVAVLVWLGREGRLDRFDSILLLAALGYATLVVIGRVLPGIAGVATVRYAYMLGLILIPVFVPKIRMSATRLSYAVLALVVALLGISHIVSLRAEIRTWVVASTESREYVETAAVFIADGEPAGLKHRIHPLARRLDLESVQRLLADGWNPSASADVEVREAVRGGLRLSSRADGGRRGARLETTAAVDTGGCAWILPRGTMHARVVGFGSVTVSGEEGLAILTWHDEHGVGRGSMVVGATPSQLTYVEPSTAAELTIAADDGAVEICGLKTVSA